MSILLVSMTFIIEGILLKLIYFCVTNMNSGERIMSKEDNSDNYKVITYNERQIPEVIKPNKERDKYQDKV